MRRKDRGRTSLGRLRPFRGRTPRPGGGRWRFLLPAALLALAALPAPALAHLRLRSSVPADRARLSAVPRQIRLAFTQPVELAFTRIEFLGSDRRTIPLAPLSAVPDSPSVVVARIQGPLVAAGTYTVRWQTAGPDGHPISGRIVFFIEPGAAGLVVREPLGPGRPLVDHHPAAAAPEGPAFDAGSPLYAAIRWLTFAGLLGIVGAAAFRLLVLGLLERERIPFAEPLIAPAAGRAACLALAMAGILVIAALLRLYAQSYALHGAKLALDPERLRATLTRTTWGLGCIVQAVASLVTLAGTLVARRRHALGWGIVALAALALAFTPAFSGHAATASRFPTLAILADGLHVIGAGGWLGSLLVVIAVGLPVASRLPHTDRGPAIAALVNAFSPTALFFAGIVVATGTFAAWLHMGALSAFWTTAYGRTLLLKLAVLSLVFGTGAYNWLRVKPLLGSEESARRLRRSALFEVAVGAAVLAVTAVLVATPPPMESGSMAGANPEGPAIEAPPGR